MNKLTTVPRREVPKEEEWMYSGCFIGNLRIPVLDYYKDIEPKAYIEMRETEPPSAVVASNWNPYSDIEEYFKQNGFEISNIIGQTGYCEYILKKI